MTKAEKYVQLRLEGMGHREASRAARYKYGAPSKAVRMYRFALKVRDNPKAIEWVSAKLAQTEADVARLREALLAARVVSEIQTPPE